MISNKSGFRSAVVLVVTGVFAALVLTLGNACAGQIARRGLLKPRLLPTPVKIVASDNLTRIGKVEVNLLPGAGRVERYAQTRLIAVSNKLRSKSEPDTGVVTRVFMGVREREAKAGSSIFAQSGLLKTAIPPEGYILLRQDDSQGPCVLILGADPNGVLYGTLTLIDIARNLDGMLPAVLRVEDAPAMKIRFMPSIIRYLDPNSLEMLDAATRGRVNAIWTGRTFGRLKTGKDEAELRRIASLCRERGITIFEQFSMHQARTRLGRDFCLCRPEDRRMLLDALGKWADLGITGLAILFDDIPTRFTCEQCRKKYHNQAELHLEITQVAQDFCRKHGIGKFIVCPTLYRNVDIHGQHGDPVEYFKYFSRIKDAYMFHCAYRSDNVRALHALGLHDWVWWYNGPFSIFGEGGFNSRARPSGYWEGFRDFYWGWYNTYLHPVRGLCIRSDTKQELATIGLRGAVGAYCAYGNACEIVRNGAFLWDPARFDRDYADRVMTRLAFGKGGYAAYMRWQKISRKWLYLFMDGATPGPGAGDSLAALTRDTRVAAQALAGLQARAGSRLSRGVDFPLTTRRILKQIQTTNRHLAERLALMQKGACRVSLGRPQHIRWGVGKSAYTRHIRDIRFMDGSHSLYLQYLIAEHPGGTFDAPPLFCGGGLCFLAPSAGNWGDLGFFGLRLGDREIQNRMASSITVVPGEKDGREACRMQWELTSGRVTLLLSLAPDGALVMDVELEPADERSACSIRLFCNPNAGRTAAVSTQRKLTGWSRAMLTATRDILLTSGKTLLDFGREDWLVFYDREYNAACDFETRPGVLNITGPCAVSYSKDDFAFGNVILKGYRVEIFMRLKVGVKKFRLRFYDLRSHGRKELAAYLGKGR